MRDNPPVKIQEIQLIGGRYDGALLPVPARAVLEGVALLLYHREGQPVGEEDGLPVTFDNFAAEIYYPEDYLGEPSLTYLEDESLYYPCTDLSWRPLKARRALGL